MNTDVNKNKSINYHICDYLNITFTPLPTVSDGEGGNSIKMGKKQIIEMEIWSSISFTGNMSITVLNYHFNNTLLSEPFHINFSVAANKSKSPTLMITLSLTFYSLNTLIMRIHMIHYIIACCWRHSNWIKSWNYPNIRNHHKWKECWSATYS